MAGGSELRLDLAADNVAPVAAEVMQAVLSANRDLAAPYGEDEWSLHLSQAVAAMFCCSERQGPTTALAVGSGVAANVIALGALLASAPPRRNVPRGQPGAPRVYCHEHAHLRVAEHDAPQRLAGCELVALPDDGSGRISAAGLAEALARDPVTGPAVLSLTNLTEAGTVLTPEQTAELTAVARRHGLRVHLDGARLMQAAVARAGPDPDLACRVLGELTWRSGVDAVSLGITKNGGMNADAVVLFEQTAAARAIDVRDRVAQRPSKLRFLSAQIVAVAEHPDWVGRAAHANQLAGLLATRINERSPETDILRPVDANHVFVRLAPVAEAALGAAGYRLYEWPRFGEGAFRLVTNWTTTRDQIERFVDVLAGAGEPCRSAAGAAR